MNPQSNDQIGHQLPTPIDQNTGQNGAGLAPQMPMPMPSNDVASTMPVAPQTVPLPPSPAGTNDTQNTPTAVNNTPISGVPVTAEDTDLIEKEWVTKAKSIVNSTQDDPYSQSQQLTAIKADYLQKRYNKNLKLSE